MKKWSKVTLVLTAALAVMALASGCTDSDKQKEQLQQALSKQAAMKTFAFSGEADLNLNPASLGSSSSQNPMTAGLLAMFTKSKLEWIGVSSVDPVRLEAELKSTPAGSSAALELPVLLKDNKLFLNIPLLNKQDEYYLVDMAELAQLTGQASSFNPESLKHITRSAAEVFKLAVVDIEPKWFKKGDTAALKDGTKAETIELEITDKNRLELSEAMRGKLAEIADVLKNGGILAASQAGSMQSNSGSFELLAPGKLVFSIDAEGYIREQKVNLTYQTTGPEGNEVQKKLVFSQAYDDINKEPVFTKEEPANVRPLSEILKLLMPQPSK